MKRTDRDATPTRQIHRAGNNGPVIAEMMRAYGSICKTNSIFIRFFNHCSPYCSVENTVWHEGQEWNRDSRWGARPSRLPRPASRRGASGLFSVRRDAERGTPEACAPPNCYRSFIPSHSANQMFSTKQVHTRTNMRWIFVRSIVVFAAITTRVRKPDHYNNKGNRYGFYKFSNWRARESCSANLNFYSSNSLVVRMHLLGFFVACWRNDGRILLELSGTVVSDDAGPGFSIAQHGWRLWHQSHLVPCAAKICQRRLFHGL